MHSFGLAPAQQLNVPQPILPNKNFSASVPLSTTGVVQRMDPLSNLQVAIKNNVDVFYFACIVPMHVLLTEDGEMDKKIYLSTWKDIPATNEVQVDIRDVQHNAGQLYTGFYKL
jgi:AP-1 complex subunit beta-1